MMFSYILLTGLAALAYLVAPASLMLAWTRWLGQSARNFVTSLLEFTGLVLATASTLIAFSMFGMVHGDFDPTLWVFIRYGGWLSLAALLFGIAGAFRKSSLRWLVPASAVGTLGFWMLTAFFAPY